MKYCISDISKTHLLSAWAFGEQKGRLALESPSMIFCVRGSPNWFKGDSSKKLVTGRKFHLFCVKVFKYDVISNCLLFLCLEFLSRANGCVVPANKWQYPTVTAFAGTVSYLYGQRKFWSWRGEVEREKGRIQRSGNNWSEKDQCSELAYGTNVENIRPRFYPVALRCKL